MTPSRSKTVLFAFQGDPMCFVHVLLNAIDLHERGREGKIVIEGEAIQLVADMALDSHYLHALYAKTKELGLIDAVCQACATKLGALEDIKFEHLPLVGDMNGHPSMGRYLEEGYEVITF
jgi:hypothetical protein